MLSIRIGLLLAANASNVKVTRCICQHTPLSRSGLAQSIGVVRAIKRQFSDVRIPERFRKKLPFEQTSESVPRDVLLYSSYDTKRTAIYVSVGGTFLALVLLQSADLIYRYSGAVKIKPPDNAPWYMWWTKVNYSSEILKYTMISVMLIAGRYADVLFRLFIFCKLCRIFYENLFKITLITTDRGVIWWWRL